jgi:hypothetical protein
MYTEKDVYPRVANMGEAGIVSLLKEVFVRIEKLEKRCGDHEKELAEISNNVRAISDSI